MFIQTNKYTNKQTKNATENIKDTNKGINLPKKKTAQEMFTAVHSFVFISCNRHTHGLVFAGKR
jgi:hypothetical protein